MDSCKSLLTSEPASNPAFQDYFQSNNQNGPNINQIMSLPCSKPSDGFLFLSEEKTKFLQ